jgi:DNA polymerase III delta prime subunit
MAFVGNVLLVQGSAASLESIYALLRSEGIEPRGNPDVYTREYGSFGIDEARDLTVRANSRAIVSSRRVFIIIAPSMTSDAQNALLKTFEEPSGDALFFLVTPSPQTLLPTLRSRAQTLSLDSSEPSLLVDPAAFLKAAPAERLDMLKPLYEKDEDEGRNIGPSVAFLAALEHSLGEDPQKNREGLRSIYRARKFIGDKGSLVKALLEQMALLI